MGLCPLNAGVQSLVRELDPTCMPQLRVCMPPLRSPPAATKTQCNQINKQILKKKSNSNVPSNTGHNCTVTKM